MEPMDEDSSMSKSRPWKAYELWDDFEVELREHLEAMTEAGDQLHLDLGSPDAHLATVERTDDGWRASVLPSGLRDGITERVYLELSAAGWRGDPITGAWSVSWGDDQLAQMVTSVTEAVSWALLVPLPYVLTCRGTGTAADRLPLAVLTLTDEAPVEEDPIPDESDEVILCGQMDLPGMRARALAVEPANRDEVIELVQLILTDRFGQPAEPGPGGTLALEHLGQPVMIHVDRDEALLGFMARVAHNVPSAAAAAVATATLNFEHRYISWIVQPDNDIWQVVNMPVSPFVPNHFETYLDNFLQTLSVTRDDLVLRLGAEAG